MIASAKITALCPCACTCCSDRQINFRSNRNRLTLPLDKFSKFCRFIAKSGGTYIAISGGEPTILSNLNNYISTAKKYDLVTRINTNGWNLSMEGVQQWLRLGVDQVVLSCYANTPQTMECVRGNPHIFERTMAAKDVIGQLRTTNAFMFVIQTTLQHKNIHELPDIFQMAVNCHADLFWPSLLENADNYPHLDLTDADIQWLSTDGKQQLMAVLEGFPAPDLCQELHRSVNLLIERVAYRQHNDAHVCEPSKSYIGCLPDGRITLCPCQDYELDKLCTPFVVDDLDSILLSDLEKHRLHYSNRCRTCPQGRNVEFKMSYSVREEHEKVCQ